MPHTEGPWRIEAVGELELAEEFDILGPQHVDADNCQYIATTHSGDDANARLIAQAPKMYALLKEWELSIPNGHFLECPVCGGELDDPRKTRGICVSALGHEKDCELAAVLKAVEGEA